MKKKIVLGVLSIILFFSFLFFYYFKLNPDKELVEEKKDLESAEKENIELIDNKLESSNLIEDVSYSAKDTKGNEYFLKAKEGTIDQNENNLIFLKSVNANINLKNYELIEISSNFGKYNINNYDTIFSKNVIITYLNNKITGDYLDFSLDKNFSGYLNFKPFFLSSDFYFNYVSQKKLFKNESLLFDLMDTELLNNPNLNAIFNIKIDKIDKFEFLNDFLFKVQLDNGRIFITNFDANWNESISIKSNDIEFINDENGKKLVGEIILNFEDVEKFFRYFQIKRNYRDVFKKISSDFVYDFTEEKLILNNIKIDNKSNQILESFLDEYNNKNKNLFNKVTLRNFVKDFFLTYAG